MNNDNILDEIEKMRQEFKKNHPIEYWIDNSVFNGKGLLTYAPHHVLKHPWLLFADIFREIKWAWQRVFRGWDDRVIWGMDEYLSSMMVEWITELKKYVDAIPSTMYLPGEILEDGTTTEESDILAMARYLEMMDKVIDGFSSYQKMMDLDCENYDEINELRNKFILGFNLLRDNFGSFWS